MKIRINRDELVNKQGQIDNPKELKEYTLNQQQHKKLSNILLNSKIKNDEKGL